MLWKKLIVIGDSNTQFGYSENGVWLRLLADKLQRRCDIVNRGFAGYNTRYLKQLTPKILAEFPAESICGVIVLLGTNDSAGNSLQHVPLDEYKRNMKDIVGSILNYGVAKENLILITPAKIDDVKWSKSIGSPSTHLDYLVKDYAGCCKDICKELNLKCIDLYGLMGRATDYEKYLFDGLHFSPSGGKLLFENLTPIIDDLFMKNKFNFPYWKDLDNREELGEILQFSKK
jgi:lysophospholipase L1-like esterase